MRYSLIIPHFNLPDKLRRLLATVPVREDLEVLVVDDCSTKYRAELEALKAEFPHVRFLSTEENGGGGKARNTGLRQATGDYLIFADADDFFLPTFSALLDKYAHKEYDMTIFDAISLDEDTLSLSHRNEHLSSQIARYRASAAKSNVYFRYYFGEPWCRIISRRLIEKHSIRFDEIRIHNDTKFAYLTGHYAEKIYVDPMVAYCIIDRPCSVSKCSSDDKIKLRIEVFARKSRFLQDHGVKEFDPMIFPPFVDAIKSHDFKRLKEYIQVAERSGLTRTGFMKEAAKYKLKRIAGKS
ncbi:MAG: glycosyltransferase [Duncaniella sp.]|nr:glycosyltransferase [Duncaniella sp.]